VYFNFIVKFNSPNKNKNIQYWWEKSGKYGSGLDLSKDTLSIRNSCNSNNDVFEEMTERRLRRILLNVWQYINKLYNAEF
jgi:hypothetical protein